MTRPEITAKLSAMIEKKINPHNDPRMILHASKKQSEEIGQGLYLKYS
jgi:hypothetical protein|nr:MAG TPA: hypothetical protein [Caudoviricetes sp.]